MHVNENLSRDNLNKNRVVITTITEGYWVLDWGFSARKKKRGLEGFRRSF